MNILVVTYAYPPKLSGVAQVVQNTYKHLLKSNSVNTVGVLTANYDNLNSFEVDEGLRVYRYEGVKLMNGRVSLPGISFIKMLNKAIAETQPDQIHLHTRFAVDNLFALMIAKQKGIKVVEVEYLSNYISGESFFTNAMSYVWDKTISKIIFKFSDKIVAISDSVKIFIEKKLGVNPKKVVAIPNACGIEPSQMSFQQKFDNKKTFNLFFAARFVSLKNPILVIKSIAKLAKIRDDFHFYMAGDGILGKEVLELVKQLNLQSRVTYLGKLDPQEMKSRFETTDIFINLSLLEGLPGGVMEALFMNNICIVSDVGGNNDIIKVKETLIAVNKLNPESIATKIDWVMNNIKTLVPKFEENKKWATNYFTWKEVIIKYNKYIFHDFFK